MPIMVSRKRPHSNNSRRWTKSSVWVACFLSSSPCMVCESLQTTPILSSHRPPTALPMAPRSTVATKSKTKKRSTATKSRRKKKVSSNNKNQDYPNRYEMLEHDILTAGEEQFLGTKVRRAIQVKEQMTQLLEQKRNQDEGDYLQDETSFLNRSNNAGDDEKMMMMMMQEEDLEGLSIYGLEPDAMERFEKSSLAASSIYSQPDSFEEEEEEEGAISLWGVPDPLDVAGQTQVAPPPEWNVHVTEDDIRNELGIPGGKAELTRILVDGALARDKMISSNIRLVVSIAKKWCQQTASSSGDANDHRLATLYAGSWTRPSLDEAIQEGILGLAEAADRFEPERKFKFATYATYWVTSFVRKCFQQAATGCLRVPPNYHGYTQQYQKIVKEHYLAKGYSPSMDEIAEEMNLAPKRLEFILKSTRALVSVDAPATLTGFPGQGGKAGSDDPSSGNNLVLANLLSSDEPQPEEQVENSLLRQCLENAMATELSPHERDVLRLRHGLDDGVSRSAREVVELCGGSISVSDVRSAEMRAFRKLRSPYSVHTYHLLGFLDYVDADVNTVQMKR